MYPNLYYLVKDLLGLDLAFLKMFQSFGVMVALSFLVASYLFTAELKRKENEGLLSEVDPDPIKKESNVLLDYIMNGVIGFILGFKLFFIAQNFGVFLENTQTFILSTQGSWIGGFFGAIGLVALKMSELKKNNNAPSQPLSGKVHPYELVGQMTTIAAIGGIIGAKIFHNLENWDDFIVDPIGALLSFSGLTMYGGLLVGAGSVIYFAHKKKIPLLPLVDACAPGLMLAYGVGRIGCQVAGDGDWGIVAPQKPNWLSFIPDWMWSYRYPHNVNEVGIAMKDCAGRFCAQLPEGVFPTPLYESIACIALFFVIWSLRKKIVQPGVVFSFYLLLNGFERFFIEKIRVNNQYHFGSFGITQAEIISTLLFILGGFGIYYFSKKRL